MQKKKIENFLFSEIVLIEQSSSKCHGSSNRTVSWKRIFEKKMASKLQAKLIPNIFVTESAHLLPGMNVYF